MPELPEVETVTRALRPHLMQRSITRVETFAPQLRYTLDLDWPLILDVPVVLVHRRGRYSLIDLANRQVLLIHLGMTGSCRVTAPEVPRKKHEHVVWHLNDGLTWRFADTRKFGIIQIHALPDGARYPACLDALGPEPLTESFTGKYLHQLARPRKTPIKTLLMDNAVVTGVGNIYASEACFLAGVRPTTRANRVSGPRCQALVQAVKGVLTAAIDAGGTTIIDFERPDGQEGYFARELQVYGRVGEPCKRCAQAPIKRVVLSGRSTFYCPACQS